MKNIITVMLPNTYFDIGPYTREGQKILQYCMTKLILYINVQIDKYRKAANTWWTYNFQGSWRVPDPWHLFWVSIQPCMSACIYIVHIKKKTFQTNLIFSLGLWITECWTDLVVFCKNMKKITSSTKCLISFKPDKCCSLLFSLIWPTFVYVALQLKNSL